MRLLKSFIRVWLHFTLGLISFILNCLAEKSSIIRLADDERVNDKRIYQ